MSTDPVKAESSLEEQLVAYLDGELDAEAVRRIEERLAAEPEVREALSRLERTWDMLDELGSTPVGDGFTRTTLEMVTVAAEEDVQHALAAAPVRNDAAGGSLGRAFLRLPRPGFWRPTWHCQIPTVNCCEDLPLLENLEEYSRVDDLQFLQLLKENGQTLFPKEKDQKETAESAAKPHPRLEGFTKSERIAYIDSLPRDKKSGFVARQGEFRRSSACRAEETAQFAPGRAKRHGPRGT